MRAARRDGRGLLPRGSSWQDRIPTLSSTSSQRSPPKLWASGPPGKMGESRLASRGCREERLPLSDVGLPVSTHTSICAWSLSHSSPLASVERVKTLCWWPLTHTPSPTLTLSTRTAEVGRLGVINPCSGGQTEAERGRCLPSVLCIARAGWGWSPGPRGPPPSPRDGPPVQVTVR